jgi:hypothetical protein
MGFGKEIQMGHGAGIRRTIAAALAVALTLVFAPLVQAKTEDIIAPSDLSNPHAESGWQAGTCKNEPAPLGTAAQLCSVATPDQFFEEAAAHPNWGFTQFIVRSEAPGETPVGELKTVRVDLPVGLSVNPSATVRCPLTTFEIGASGCPGGSEVGKSQVTVSLPPLGTPVGPTAPLTEVTVYNVEPKPGESARFGLELAGNEVFLEGDDDWSGDYHEGFTIHVPEALPAGLGGILGLLTGEKGLILENRLVFNGRAGDGTFITTPSTCFGSAYSSSWVEGEQPNGPSGSIYSTFLKASSVGEEKEPGYSFPQSAEPPLQSPIPPRISPPGTSPTSPKECRTIPYEPSIAVDPNTPETDSPTGSKLEVSVPHVKGGGTQDSSDTREAAVTLPAGMGINPSAANGLEVCTDGQFAKGTKNPVACPTGSRVGTVTIQSPPLPEKNALEQPIGPVLTGPVFVGQQLSRDPLSGNEYRIFVDAESARYGISVRLIGHVRANPQTGQLTTTFEETPQVPFTSFVIQLDGGPRATLTSPATCGPHTTLAKMTPWSSAQGATTPGAEDGPSTAPPATPTSEFTLTSAPGGGACAKKPAERPFAPTFAAGTAGQQGGSFTKLNMDIVRKDGNQELKGVEVSLPPGLTAKLAGVRYCPEAALEAAAANSGVAEKASSSCPANSLVGSATVVAGSGSEPLHIDAGKAFLAGPYNGAPLSLAVITPATAGPFDLGTVVVRVALFVDPKTAQVKAVADPIPHVYGGSLLDVRSISLKIDRDQFALNPTNCSPFAFSGALRGGGADPNDPASFSSLAVSAPFQATGCDGLGFKPKLFMRLFGGTRRAQNPKLRSILVARPGDANIQRAVVALPHALILEQASLSNVCTRVQFAANACPKNSIYGFAEATTPLLDGPLKGPVYLRSSDNPLPDLVAALHGQVDIEVDGVTDNAKGGRLRETFSMLPDVPVTKFTLTLRGGKGRGLLVNSRNLCPHRLLSNLVLGAQNGKSLHKKKLKIRKPAACHRRRR